MKPQKAKRIPDVPLSIDTITQHLYAEQFRPCKRKFKKTFTINDSTYTLFLQSKISTEDSLHISSVVNEDTLVRKTIFHSPNEEYTVQLIGPNQAERFEKTLTRKDFFGTISHSLLLKNTRFSAQIIDFAPQFNAFVLTTDFKVWNSDVGEEALLLIDFDGNVIKKTQSRWFGGPTAIEEVQISENGKMILASNHLLISDQKDVSFQKETEIMGTEFLFDQRLLLTVYDYDDSLNRFNAKILDTNGRIQSVFKYQGYFCELSCEIFPFYVEPINSYYLYDGEQNTLRKITESPVQAEIIAIHDLPERNMIDSNEVQIEFQTYENKRVFYVDTISEAVTVAKSNVE